MSIVDDYWASYEESVDTLGDFLECADTIGAYQQVTDSRFVWRGVTNSSYPLNSSLARLHIRAGGKPPTEREMQKSELIIMESAREWGIDWHDAGGRLAALEVLARMQHFDVPTRMLDFTFNPLVALWFAVQGDMGNDGRVFALDISGRVVGRSDAMRDDPWWWPPPSPRADSPWSTRSWIWRPPPLERRMVRQQGCFLMGGVPSTQPPRNVRIRGRWRPLQAAEVRECMSVPFALIGYPQAEAARTGRRLRGRPPTTSAFTLRVTSKAGIGQALERTFGLSAAELFPDVQGFARYGPIAR
jgi:hypothetical protein